MPKVKLSHSNRLEIVNLYRQGWKISAILCFLSDNHGVDVDWSTIKKVIGKYQSGTLFTDDSEQQQPLTKFRKVSDEDLYTVKSILTKNFN